jgi:hypothetical protein
VGHNNREGGAWQRWVLTHGEADVKPENPERNSIHLRGWQAPRKPEPRWCPGLWGRRWASWNNLDSSSWRHKEGVMKQVQDSQRHLEASGNEPFLLLEWQESRWLVWANCACYNLRRDDPSGLWKVRCLPALGANPWCLWLTSTSQMVGIRVAGTVPTNLIFPIAQPELNQNLVISHFTVFRYFWGIAFNSVWNLALLHQGKEAI